MHNVSRMSKYCEFQLHHFHTLVLYTDVLDLEARNMCLCKLQNSLNSN